MFMIKEQDMKFKDKKYAESFLSFAKLQIYTHLVLIINVVRQNAK